MKKKIYDLKDKEELEVMHNLIKTPYGRQFFMLVSFVIFMAILAVFLFIFFIILNLLTKTNFDYMLLLLVILLIFILLGMSLFAKMKWLSFIKEYYDEINK